MRPEGLDDPQTYRELDPSGMGRLVGELPRQVQRAQELVGGLDLPPSHRRPRSVAVLGMGGSAIAGDLAGALVGSVPLQTLRGYDLPRHVGPETLVIGSSHSGNTEETLSAFARAGERGCPRVALTTGGRLAQIAREEGLPLVRFDYPVPPRAALGYSLILLLGTLEQAGVWEGLRLGPLLSELGRVVAQCGLESLLERNPAKRLATDLHGRMPIVYGAEHLAPVARRWKGQFNENAKSFAAFEELPEADHNAVVGYEHPAGAPVAIVFLESSLYHPRTGVRVRATADLAAERGHPVHRHSSQAGDRLGQMLGLVHLGDWTSYYLALLNGADPTPIRAIDRLKALLTGVA